MARFSDCDILSINETNLKPQQLFSLPGYHIYRNDRQNKQGGGVLLAIRNNIKCFEIFNQTIEDNETLAVQIETFNGFLLIASIYIPPNAKLNCDVFQHLYKINNNCLILGDLNAALCTMGSKKTNAKGYQLQQLLADGFLQCIDNNLMTYARNNYEEKIDWILASQPTLSFIDNVETYPSLGLKEDHRPLTFHLNMSAELKPGSPRLSYNYKTADSKLYRSKLNDLLHKIDINQNITNAHQIETYVKELTEKKPNQLPFQDQVSRQVNLIKKRIKLEKPTNKSKTPPITTKEIKAILKQLPNSAPGPDLIHNRCLKNYTSALVQHLEKIFNAIINLGHIPGEWKKANIILLLKPKKDQKNSSSYRPISLLS
ncbi:unnamed protein product [Rotaria sp. Silwood1]|nr:unnamed protein product [Rotaria sp. Silwood1]